MRSFRRFPKWFWLCVTVAPVLIWGSGAWSDSSGRQAVRDANLGVSPDSTELQVQASELLNRPSPTQGSAGTRRAEPERVSILVHFEPSEEPLDRAAAATRRAQVADFAHQSGGYVQYEYDILPNVVSPIIVSVSFGIGAIALSEVILSFFGLGVQPPRPSLGVMIGEVTARGNTSVSVLRDHPEQLLAPIIVVWLLIFCWNIVGDALNDVQQTFAPTPAPILCPRTRLTVRPKSDKCLPFSDIGG